jgi:peptidyl-tRNA hydrolase, PTH1 family
MECSFLIAGLGNPGPRYVCTPHNAGFAAADLLREKCRGGEWEPSGGGLVCHCRWRRVPFAVLKPQQFMNLSGESVICWIRRLQLPPERLVVLYDDLDLPFGSIRLRMSGGTGGHHGMESIQERLGTAAYPRVRIGIADPEVPKHEKVDYLLTPLAADRWEILQAGAEKAALAVRDALTMGWPKAMSLHNREIQANPE